MSTFIDAQSHIKSKKGYLIDINAVFNFKSNIPDPITMLRVMLSHFCLIIKLKRNHSNLILLNKQMPRPNISNLRII